MRRSLDYHETARDVMNAKLAKVIVAGDDVLVVSAEELADVLDELDIRVEDSAGSRVMRFRGYEVVIDRSKVPA